MREAMLILHLIGMAMGLGTSFAFMFLGIAAGKMEASKRGEFILNVLSLGRMGHIGLVLLVISGGYLITPYWSVLGAMPLLIAKLVLVLVLGALLGVISSVSRKARQGDTEQQLRKLPVLGRLAMTCSLCIVVLAVLVFR